MPSTSQVLGDLEIRERLLDEPVRVDREHARHERVAISPSVEQVLGTLAKLYGMKVEDLMKGKRAKQNEPRKVGMYLVKELCDLRLREIAERFGTGSNGMVAWADHRISSQVESDFQVVRAHRDSGPTKPLQC